MTTESRIVSFDLMPHDPDYYFVLTEALREFAARHHGEAVDPQCGDAEAHTRWAETAEDALDRIDEAMSTPTPAKRPQPSGERSLVHGWTVRLGSDSGREG
jgi:hypothetical protein